MALLSFFRNTMGLVTPKNVVVEKPDVSVSLTARSRLAPDKLAGRQPMPVKPSKQPKKG